MIHSDDQGLVLAPKIAPIQVVIIPIFNKDYDWNEAILIGKQIMKSLSDLDIRVKLDDTDHNTPGYKYNYWELKGVPIRIEIGINDVKEKKLTLKRRDDLKNKIIIDYNETSAKKIINILDDIQISLFKNAKEKRDEHRVVCYNWDSFIQKLNQKNVVLVPWCMDNHCEETIKKKTKDEGEEEKKDEFNDEKDDDKKEKREGLRFC